MNIPERSIPILAAALLMAAVFAAAPASAQAKLQDTQDTFQLSGVIENPCTAEDDRISVDFTVQVHQQVWKTASDALRIMVDEDTAVDGTNQFGHPTFAYGSSLSDVIYDGKGLTLYKFHKANTNDDLHFVTVMDFDPSTLEMMVTLETACHDGGPDSKE